MKVKGYQIFLAVIIIIFGGVYLAKGLGIWETTSSRVPAKFESGVFEGHYNPEDIRGSFSFADIERSFNVKSEVLAKAFNIEVDNPDGVKCKDLETFYGYLEGDIEIGTGSVKYFVSLYNGLPYTDIEYLPSTALEILIQENKIDEKAIEEIMDYIIDVEDTKVNSEIIENIEDKAVEETEEHETLVNGQTTITQLMGYGLEINEIEELLGVKVNDKNILVRDLCRENGLQFSTIKDKLNDLLAR